MQSVALAQLRRCADSLTGLIGSGRPDRHPRKPGRRRFDGTMRIRSPFLHEVMLHPDSCAARAGRAR
ncbi:hypothetical protein, partial [Burkholderia cenocepacia]|uniref:hypothetical protein n=1 Tax=Burkholderia cenocepacia TaxID=95486 RepID=UPI001C0C4A8C